MRDSLMTLNIPTGPIWPMSDEELIKWKADMEAMKTAPPTFPVLSEKLKAKFIAERKAFFKEILDEIKKETPVKASKKSTSSAVEDNPARQQRMGQTKMIDDLIKEGKSDDEIEKIIREKIPAYPAERLPKLIKLRHYHLKNKK